MAKPGLVLLPGLLCDAALWQAQIDRFGDRFDILVADLARDDTLRKMAGRVLAAAPERFALAGLSMGGYVAQEIVREAPARVRRVALLDTSARPDTPEQAERRHALIALAKTGKFKGVTPRLLPLLIHPARLQDRAVTGVVMAMAERVGQAAFLRQQQTIIARPDSRPDLPRIGCAALVLCGRQDVLTPPALSEEMARAIPDARLVLVDDCGHLAPLEQPEIVNAALEEWLAPEL
ncbi:MAG: alpha/beta fold hydrolase [Proteobacteria bacterium]|nr:alpha/beta fold hydrolase [Pseudomonadota bacterium]